MSRGNIGRSARIHPWKILLCGDRDGGPRLGRRSGPAQRRVDKSPGVAEARGFRQGAPWPRLGRAVTFPGTEAREPPSPAGRAGARRRCGPLRLPGQPRRFLLVGRDRLSAPFSNCAGAGAIGRSGRSQWGRRVPRAMRRAGKRRRERRWGSPGGEAAGGRRGRRTSGAVPRGRKWGRAAPGPSRCPTVRRGCGAEPLAGWLDGKMSGRGERWLHLPDWVPLRPTRPVAPALRGLVFKPFCIHALDVSEKVRGGLLKTPTLRSVVDT